MNHLKRFKAYYASSKKRTISLQANINISNRKRRYKRKYE